MKRETAVKYFFANYLSYKFVENYIEIFSVLHLSGKFDQIRRVGILGGREREDKSVENNSIACIDTWSEVCTIVAP